MAAGILALFYALFGLRPMPVTPREFKVFCARVAGDWWSTGADKGWVGFVTLTPIEGGRTLSMEGRAYNRAGRIAATWESRASCVYLEKKRLYYYWTGSHLGPPTADYEGFGELTFHDSSTTERPESGHGMFSDTDLKDVKSSTKRTPDYRRCKQQEIDIIQSGDSDEIGKLVCIKLDQVERRGEADQTLQYR